MELKEWTRYLDELLDIHGIEDEAANGLQVEGRPTVAKVGFAVDYSPELVAAAQRDGLDALFVHHGAIWGGLRHLRGVTRAFLRPLIVADISLYVAHLPLDIHPTLGHGAGLAALLGLQDTAPFGAYRGRFVGLVGSLPQPESRETFLEKVRRQISEGAVLQPFGADRVSRVALVSGGGAKLVGEAAEAGVDTFLTGESSHSVWHLARTAAVNLCFAGHYRTEVPGIRLVRERVARDLGLDCRYYDFPTPY